LIVCGSSVDKAGNDDDLATEVLAALWYGKETLLRNYVESRLRSGRPGAIARAVMVAGFPDLSQFNSWSRHWFGQLFDEERAEDLWRYSVLLTKIVDGRIDLWEKDAESSRNSFKLFWPSIEKRVDSRVKKWRDQRKKKLFGDEAPAEIFLSQ